jgi:hypothetical protein
MIALSIARTKSRHLRRNQLKKLVIAVMLFSLPFTVSADIGQYKAEAKKIIGAFFEELKGELGKGIKAGGPVAAIGKGRPDWWRLYFEKETVRRSVRT